MDKGSAVEMLSFCDWPKEWATVAEGATSAEGQIVEHDPLNEDHDVEIVEDETPAPDTFGKKRVSVTEQKKSAKRRKAADETISRKSSFHIGVREP